MSNGRGGTIEVQTVNLSGAGDRKKRKKPLIIGLLCGLILIVAGTIFTWWWMNREERFEQSTLVVQEDLSLVEKLREDFPKIYLESELKQMIEEHMKPLLTAGIPDSNRQPITLRKFEVKNEKAYVELEYYNMAIYNQYYNAKLFVGEVGDELFQLYPELNDSLKKETGKKIVVTDQPIAIRVPGVIRSVSRGLVKEKEHLAVLQDNVTGPIYVIYE